MDSVGLVPKRLPFTTSNTIVRTFRHAVSLDERRAKFKANLWNRPTEDEKKLGIHELDQRLQRLKQMHDEKDEKHPGHHHHHEQRSNSLPASPLSRFGSKNGHGHDTNVSDISGDDKGSDGEHGQHHSHKNSINRGAKIWTLGNKQDKALNRFESMYSDRSSDGPSDVEEVWFAGCHCGT